MRNILFFLFLYATSIAFGQGYKTLESEYFDVGDSIRVDIQLIGDPYFRGWNVRGKDKRSLVNFLARNPRIKIGVNSYADSKGSNEANLERSKLRAASIVEWLTDGEGFDPRRFSHTGWGEERLIISDEEISAYRGNDRVMWDTLHAVNRRIICVIENVEQRVNCPYRASTQPELGQYYKSDPKIMKIGGRFRLDFVEFDLGKETISNFESKRVEYEELAAFIHCHPSVTFQLAVHSDSRQSEISSTDLTKARAIELKEILVEKFSISADRLVPIGFGSGRPIIPDLIINELGDDKPKQDELHAINRRSELEIVGIGAFNDIAQNRNFQLSDRETTKEGVLFQDYEHQFDINTLEEFDSLKVLYARSEVHVLCTKIGEKHWIATVITPTRGILHATISFVGWKSGKNVFLASKSFTIEPLSDPEIYLGDYQISTTDLNEYEDLELFSSGHLVARYDTSLYAINKSYPIVGYSMKVGRKKFDENGADFSPDLKRAIRKAKPDMIIRFNHFTVQENLTHDHEIHIDYSKKTRTKKNVLFQDIQQP
ncbi:MAG: outer membrane protein OmpA-like peptidoglycan-associated protein [Crocinitomicaceae bacterium]|jgi:outer membrane protein OmpA-like peptidoglycan-associated protein